MARRLRANFPEAQVDGSGSSTTVRIPIYLKAGVERDAIINYAAEQMSRIADALSKALPPPG